jgi:putative inorganic carbon (HCO3(-)) transporter
VAIQVFDLRPRAPSADGAVRNEVGASQGIRIASLLAFSLFTMVVGQLGRVPLLSAGAKEAPVLANDVAVAVAVVVGLWLSLRNRGLRLDAVTLVALGFAGVGGLSALMSVPRFGLSGFELAFSLAYLLRWAVYLGLYVVVIDTLSPREGRQLLKVVERAVLVFAGLGILQSIFLPGFAQIVFPDAALYTQWDPQGRRLVSTFLDPNLAGGLIMVVLLLICARLVSGEPVPLWKPGLLVTALVITMSRSSILAFLVGLAVIGLLVRRVTWRALAGSILAIAVGLMAAPWLLRMADSFGKLSLSDGSLLTRFVNWGRALRVLADHPIVGVGFNTYGFVQLRYGFGDMVMSSFGLDGGLLFIAVMTGFVGVTLYSILLFLVLQACKELWSSDRSSDDRYSTLDGAVGLGVAAATVALLIHSLFVNSIIYPPIMQTMWILWGIVFVLNRRLSPDELLQ